MHVSGSNRGSGSTLCSRKHRASLCKIERRTCVPDARAAAIAELCSHDSGWLGMHWLTQEGGRPQWRAQVQAAAALGTGGFRDPVSGQSLTRPEWTALWQSLQQFFLQEAAIASVVARPITGSEEGQLAWQGVRESEQPSERFAIMEVGGATVQFATADGPSELDLARVAVSDVRGQDVTFERFADPVSTYSGFAVCYSPDHRERQSGSACIDFLFDRVFADSRVAGSQR